MKFRRMLTSTLAASALIFSLAGAADAAEISVTDSELPTVKAEIRAAADELAEGYSAALDGCALELAEEAVTSATDFVFYIDVSLSLNTEGFDAARTLLNGVADSLAEGDTLTINTFGDSITTVLDHSADTEAAHAAIDALEMTDQNTCLYEALIEAYAAEDAADARIYFLSDGENSIPEADSVYSLSDAEAAAADSAVYVRALCFDSADEAVAEEFASLTENAGGFVSLSAEDMAGYAAEICGSKPVVCEASFTVPEDYEPNSAAVLSVTVGGETIESEAFDTGAWPVEETELIAAPDPTAEPETETEAEPEAASFPVLYVVAAVVIVAAVAAVLVLRKKKSPESAAKTAEPAAVAPEAEDKPAEDKKSRQEKKSVLFFFEDKN